MAYHRYLSVIANELATSIAPELKSERARAALTACVRTLGRLAYAFEPPGDSARVVPEIPELPPAIHQAFGGIAPRPASAQSELRLPSRDPPEDIAFRFPAAAGMAAAAKWLDSGVWLTDRRLKSAANALLAWEYLSLTESETRADELDKLRSMAPSGSRMVDIDRHALEGYLRERYPHRAGVHIADFKQVAGGRSKQTALFTLEGVPELPRQLVVRRDHPSGIGMSVVAEFPAIVLAHRSGLKVAQPLFVETSKIILGGSFSIFERARGRVPVDYWGWPASEKLALALAEQLAKLHTIEFAPLANGLTCTIDSAAEAPWVADLDKLHAAIARMGNAPSMMMSSAFGWMRQNVAAITSRLALVHADAHFHNVHVEGEEFIALLDWELVHVGHPAEDLGYCRPVVEKMTTWSKFMAAYVAAGGQAPTRAEIDYFTLREIVRLITMLMPARNMIQEGAMTDVLMTEIGTDFIQRLIYRLAGALRTVLA
jgi:aminoglycoside phosphotransferase (APT) family kinase protein